MTRSEWFARYAVAVRAVGPGFHPDTPVGGYSPPLPPALARELAALLEAPHGDVYALALQALADAREEEDPTGYAGPWGRS